MEDGMGTCQLSTEELSELNRRAFPTTADVVFNFNLNNNVGVNSPTSSIFNLTSDGKTSMPHDDELHELRNSETSQKLDSNLVLDGKIS